MKEKIESLYETINEISAEFMIYQKRNNIALVKKIIPQMQEFILWFLEENRLGIEEEQYQEMRNHLLQILKDILDAIEQEDCVLLHDAIAYGLMEYLKLFVESKQEEENDDNL